jgi:nitroimidazol reductase NimA-like FMN-containing flavoprotein (pyridoxamine 5'-phosphate oxidase superfamily)
MSNRFYDPQHRPINLQRRPHQALDEAATRDLISRARIGHVATVWDDQPFINVSNFWYDAERHEIVFHSNLAGRVRANSEHAPKVCFEASEFGRLLPSNVALEFSLQYESVIAFGTIRVLAEPDEIRRALYGMIAKYFPAMTPGQEYRPITDEELAQTSVYAIAIESWSGKRNWVERAVQSDDWPALDAKWFD